MNWKEIHGPMTGIPLPCWESDGYHVWLANANHDTIHAKYWMPLIKPELPLPHGVKEYEPEAMLSIDEACVNAMAMAQRDNKPVRFYFNSIPMLAKPDSTLAELIWVWDLARFLQTS